MEPEKKTQSTEGDTTTDTGSPEQNVPADALSRTPDELDEEQAAKDAADKTEPTEPGEKKISPLKKLFRKLNLYFLIFLLLVVVGIAATVVNYLNAQKAPEDPTVASQSLTEDALKQLANTDATVGGAAQTLTIQGNAIIAGQTLMRGNLNVAGNFQSGGSIQGPTLTISGRTNLAETQINSLQVATNTAIQGDTTLNNLNVSGTSSFAGAMTASQITVTRLVLSGNATLQVPNHLSFTGPSPGRTVNGGVLGTGGSASSNGSDTSGTASINTGNNPTAGCMIQINFNQRYTAQPRVLVSPATEAAGRTQFYTTRTPTSFSICASTAPPANQPLMFDYFVMG